VEGSGHSLPFYEKLEAEKKKSKPVRRRKWYEIFGGN